MVRRMKKDEHVPGRRHGEQIQVTCYLPPLYVARLRELSKRTHVPINAYLRMAVEKVLREHD